MTHSLKYIGITRDALIDAAKYDPPSADLVTALVEALGTESADTTELEMEVDVLKDEVDSLKEEINSLEVEISALEHEIIKLEEQLDELKTNQETESND